MKVQARAVLLSSFAITAMLLMAACGEKGAVDSNDATDASVTEVAKVTHVPADVYQGTAEIKPVYPDKAVTEDMKLNFVFFEFYGPGMLVTPLPPQLNKDVEVKLAAPAKSYTLKAGRAECVNKLKVAVGENAAQLLDPKQGEAITIKPENFGGADSLTVRIGLGAGAENNWSCSVLITPEG